jgi:small-conductance mechanosensitive channel
MLGTLGLTIGLSLQNTVSTIWDGLGLLVNDIYRIGDVIEFKLPGIPYIISGKVVYFNLFHTKLIETSTNTEINISNTSLKNGIVTNKSVVYRQ